MVNKGGNAVIRPLHESAEGFSYMSKQGDSPDYECCQQLRERRRRGVTGFHHRDVAGRRHFLLEKLVTEKKISEEKSRRKSIWQ